jgi:type VI secretion system secreted protein Hcp
LVALEGAVDIFLKLAGIDGESVDKAHAKEIDVLEWTWGVSNPGPVGSSGTPSVQDLVVKKYVDKASPALLLKTLNGTPIADATLVVRSSASGTPVDIIKIVLTTVFVRSISTGGSTDSVGLEENISLGFSKVTYTYTPINSSGGAGTPISTSWDLATNKGF